MYRPVFYIQLSDGHIIMGKQFSSREEAENALPQAEKIFGTTGKIIEWIGR